MTKANSDGQERSGRTRTRTAKGTADETQPDSPDVPQVTAGGSTQLSTAPPHTPVKVKQTEVREFTEVVTSNGGTRNDASGGEDRDDADDDHYPELPPGFVYVDDTDDDPVARFMKGIGGGDLSGYRVGIKRLPDPFDMRGRFRQPCNIEIQHGDIEFDPENIINNIRDTLGGGRYRLTIKADGGRFVTRPIETLIADPSSGDFVIHQQQQGQQKPGKPLTPVQEMIARAQEINDLRDALFPDRDKETSAPATVSGDSDSVLATAVIKNPEVLNSVISGLVKKFQNSEPTTEPWYKEVLMTFVRNDEVSPLLVHAGVSIIASVTEILGNAKNSLMPKPNAGSSAPNPPVPSQQLALSPIPPMTRPSTDTAIGSNGAGQPTQEQTMDNATADEIPPHLKVLDYLINTKLTANAKVGPDEQWIKDMRDRWPEELKQAEGIIRFASVAQIKIILLGIDPEYSEALELPHADQFLTDLKKLVSGKLTKKADTE